MKWPPRLPQTPARKLPLDRIALAIVLGAAMFLAGRGWLKDHPQHDPFTPLDLREGRGWATQTKLDALRSDPEACRAVLEQSEIAFTSLPPTGEGECRREDRLVLDDAPLTPGGAEFTCPVAVGVEMWIRQDLQPIAEAELGSRVERIEHLGTYSCRRIGGGDGASEAEGDAASDGASEEARWSEHSRGNAIDIAAFVLEDGRRISVLQDWQGEGSEARFLHAARDAACTNFGTVLSPDYNADHADHLHLDQGRSTTFGFCR